MLIRRSVVVLLCVVPALANAAPTSVVYPTGIAATDRANLQAAVNGGGTVLLKATDASGAAAAFELGTSTVLLTTDVDIVGETVGSAMTTIHRGRWPFRPQFFPRVKASVRGIHFDAPFSAAVLVTSSLGFTFTDNVVTDVVGAPAFGLTKGQAVWVTDNGLHGAIVGDILIQNNVVQRVYADLSYGVALASFDATARIANNTFIDTKDTGILVVKESQPVWIEDNLVQGGAPYPAFSSAGNGIFAGQGLGPIYIQRNTVVCDNPFADGIALSGDVVVPRSVPGSSVVENNTVTMHGSQFGGITIYGQIQPSLVANNRVAGDGAFALDISASFGNEVTSGTVFRGNNISLFQSSVADVFLDTVAQNTVLVGSSGTVIDNGTNDAITGFTPMAGGIGGALQQAQQAKLALLQRLESVGWVTDPDQP